MMFNNNNTLFSVFFIFIFVTQLISSQEISGIIYDKNTKEPLAGASVYFDNTTLGTISNIDGEFSIEYNPNIKTPLIISFIGYKTLRFDKFDSSVSLKIYLEESEESLDEVLLTYDDGLTRETKLKEFRKHYLGESENGKSCEILNEDDLILIYNSKKKQLIARSKTPIFIENNALQYLISVEIEHIELNYSFVSKNKKRFNLNYIYYSGSYFFKSFEENPTPEIEEKRELAYNGSVLHFMRALIKKRLVESGYKMFLGKYKILPKKYITVTPIESSTDVLVNIAKPLSILYDGKQQSSIDCIENEFYVDIFGNHSPINKVIFTGHMGDQRIGDTLPLDFMPINEKVEKL